MIPRVVFKLGIRNLRRGRRRTLLVGLTAAAGAAVIVVNAGFVAGIERHLVDSLVIGPMGHARISARPDPGSGRDSEFGASGLVRDPDELTALLRDIVPEARSSLGLNAIGIVAGPGGASSRVALRGIQPDMDRRVVSDLAVRAAGRMRDLSSGTAYLGAKLAERVGAAVGTTVTLTAPAPSGVLAARDAVVSGIVEPGAPWQDYFVYLPLGDLQQMLSAGTAVQEIKLTLPGRHRGTETLVAKLAAALAGARPELRVQGYEETGRFFMGIVRTARIQLGLMDLILLVAVALGVASAQILSVSERRREIGAMIALGTPRAMVRGVFLVESALLAATFGAAGALAGAAATAGLQHVGIEIHAEAFRWMIGGARLYPRVAWASLPESVLAVALAVTAAGLVPASRASALEPMRVLGGGPP